MSEPTAREFEALTQSLQNLNNTIKELRVEMSSTYARKDVIVPRLETIENAVKAHGSYFRWIVQLVVGAVLLALLGLVLVQNGGMP